MNKNHYHHDNKVSNIINFFRDILNHIEIKDFKLFVFDNNQIIWVKLFIFLSIFVPLYLFASTIFLSWLNTHNTENLYQISLLLQQNGTLPSYPPSSL